MIAHSLLSESAQRLLELMTPEHTPISAHQRSNPALQELLRAGLVSGGHLGEHYTIKLTEHGLLHTPRHRI